jgi:hypothetical protein
MNITQRVAIAPGPGFHGEIETINESGDAGVSHTTIDKSPRLQAAVIDKIKTVVVQEQQAGQASAPIANPPVERSDKPESRL